MKIVTLFGTRPEIIRLSEVIRTLDGFCEQTLVHTGQNYDPNLSDIFFHELGVRKPDVHLGVKGDTFADQLGQILARTGEVLERVRPDRLLVLGDTNSALGAIIGARMGVPVYHMEAGNRCYDDRVPEETNRRLIDHCSTVLMPYTFRSKENLVREGIARERIYVIGNPIYEVLQAHMKSIDASDVLSKFSLAPSGYFLATLHRAENVDDPVRLGKFFTGLERVAKAYQIPVIATIHPRTADKLRQAGLEPSPEHVRLIEPLGFFPFVKLEKHARAVLTDSGTVQEECCVLRVPNVTLRDVTERAETVEVGSNILSGAEPDDVLRAVRVALGARTAWAPPPEYLEPQVSAAVAKVLLGYAKPRA